MWELARAYYECSARGTVDQQGAGTEHSHGHDVGPESSPNHRHQTHEDERPREKNRDPVIISFLCANTSQRDGLLPSRSSPDGLEHGDEAGHRVGNRRHGGRQMVGLVPVRQTGVGLDRGQHRVGQRIDPSQRDKDEEHLQTAVGALPKGAPGPPGRLQRADHRLLFRRLGVQRQARFCPVCRQLSAEVKVVLPLSGHSRVPVEQDEGHQAHHHHDAQEDEEDLG